MKALHTLHFFLIIWFNISASQLPFKEFKLSPISNKDNFKIDTPFKALVCREYIKDSLNAWILQSTSTRKNYSNYTTITTMNKQKKYLSIMNNRIDTVLYLKKDDNNTWINASQPYLTHNAQYNPNGTLAKVYYHSFYQYTLNSKTRIIDYDYGSNNKLNACNYSVETHTRGKKYESEMYYNFLNEPSKSDTIEEVLFWEGTSSYLTSKSSSYYTKTRTLKIQRENRGNIKQINEEYVRMKDDGVTLVNHIFKQWNYEYENGKLVKERKYLDTIPITTQYHVDEYHYVYNNSGQLIEMVSFPEYHLVVNDSGKQVYFPDTAYYSYSYNEQNRIKSIIKRIINTPSQKTEYEYDVTSASVESVSQSDKLHSFQASLSGTITGSYISIGITSPMKDNFCCKVFTVHGQLICSQNFHQNKYYKTHYFKIPKILSSGIKIIYISNGKTTNFLKIMTGISK